MYKVQPGAGYILYQVGMAIEYRITVGWHNSFRLVNQNTVPIFMADWLVLFPHVSSIHIHKKTIKCLIRTQYEFYFDKQEK